MGFDYVFLFTPGNRYYMWAQTPGCSFDVGKPVTNKLLSTSLVSDRTPDNGKRIFNHCLDTVLAEDDDSLDGPTVVADGVENVL